MSSPSKSGFSIKRCSAWCRHVQFLGFLLGLGYWIGVIGSGHWVGFLDRVSVKVQRLGLRMDQHRCHHQAEHGWTKIEPEATKEHPQKYKQEVEQIVYIVEM